MKRAIITFTLTLGMVLSAMAQIHLPDSISQKLQQIESDTAQLNYLFTLSGKAHQSDAKLNEKLINKALELAQAYQDPYYLAKVYVKLGIQRTYQNKFQEADSLLKMSLHLYRSEGDSMAVAEVYSELGILRYYEMNDLAAIDYWIKCFNLVEGTEELRTQAYVTNNLSTGYSMLGDFENALKYARKSLDLKREMDDPRLASSYHNVGNLLHKVGKPDSAIWYLQKGGYLKKQNNDLRGLAAFYNSMSDVHAGLKQQDSSIHYIKESIALDRQMRDSVALAIDLYELGESYLKFNQNTKGFAVLDSALKISNNPRTFEKTYQLLAEKYTQLKQYKKANQYLQKYIAVHDSLRTAEKEKAIVEMKTKFETEQKEREIELLTAQNQLAEAEVERKQRQIFFAIALGLLLLGFASYFIYAQRQKYKLQDRLHQAEIDKLRANVQLLSGKGNKSETDLAKVNKRLVTPLTDRETEVLNLALQNNTNQQIADQINVSLSTVKFHFSNIYQKMDVKNRKEAIIKIASQ